MAGPTRSKRFIQPRHAAVTSGVVAIALVALVAVTQPWNVASPAGSPTPSSGAGTSSAPSTAPSPSPEGTWQALDLAPLSPPATLVASAQDDAGIQPDATFTLTSLTTDMAITTAERLDVTPAAGLDVASGGDLDHAIIRPKAPLTPGIVYRFTLRAPDGSPTTSWAFRVRSPLHVLSTLPGDATTGVPVATGIEVTFDQEGAADMADFFSISPAAKGRFERHGRTQVFVPDGLAAKTLYTVTIKAGLPRTGTDSPSRRLPRSASRPAARLTRRRACASCARRSRSARRPRRRSVSTSRAGPMGYRRRTRGRLRSRSIGCHPSLSRQTRSRPFCSRRAGPNSPRRWCRRMGSRSSRGSPQRSSIPRTGSRPSASRSRWRRAGTSSRSGANDVPRHSSRSRRSQPGRRCSPTGPWSGSMTRPRRRLWAVHRSRWSMAHRWALRTRTGCSSRRRRPHSCRARSVGPRPMPWPR